MGLVWWLIIGLIAGLIARLLVRGPGPLSLGGTLLVGLVGSLVGGFLGQFLDEGDTDLLSFTRAGLIGSIVGAVIVLLIMRGFSGRRRRVI